MFKIYTCPSVTVSEIQWLGPTENAGIIMTNAIDKNSPDFDKSITFVPQIRCCYHN